MRILVESLKRLYAQEKVSLEKLKSMKVGNTITNEEYEHITQNAEVV